MSASIELIEGKQMSWKPENYTSASPYLMVKDAEATLEFLENVFGAHRLRVHKQEEGPGITHAEARIDDTIIMMGEVPEAREAHIHVYVPRRGKDFLTRIGRRRKSGAGTSEDQATGTIVAVLQTAMGSYGGYLRKRDIPSIPTIMRDERASREKRSFNIWITKPA